ncbi:hypothetical protein FZC70_16775 [Bacillus subtilis]|nr:hypothetical protein FZC70_16775 [Bacillus subtilis]
MLQRVDKPSHSLSGLRVGAHELYIRCAPMLALPRLQRFSITLKKEKKSQNIVFWDFALNQKHRTFLSGAFFMLIF